MDGRRPRRVRQQRRAAAAPAAPAPVPQAAPYRLQGPVIRPRQPTEDELFADNWGGGNQNALTDKEKTGRRFLPLPPGAPEIEATYFEYKSDYKTGEELTDILIKALYNEHLNNVVDKRREILHHQWRSLNKQMATRLEVELDGLVAKLIGKMAELTEITNMVVPYPAYFSTFPALR